MPTLFIVFSALSAMIAFFSTAVITPVAVETWGAGTSIALLWTGWMLGGVCAYGIGRSLGRPVVRALTSHDALDRFENRISSRAPFGLVLLFQLAMPSEVPGYVLGIARYQFLKYILILGMVELPFAIGTVQLGASFVQQRSYMLLAIGAAWASSSRRGRSIRYRSGCPSSATGTKELLPGCRGLAVSTITNSERLNLSPHASRKAVYEQMHFSRWSAKRHAAE